MRRVVSLMFILLFGGCAASNRVGRHEPPARSRGLEGRRGDPLWEERIFRAYEQRLETPGNPVRKVSDSPERMSPRAFKKWAARHDRKVTGWERRQAEVVATRFGITANEVIHIHCSVLARHFSAGSR